MTRRIKRTAHFDVALDLKDDGFIRPPREAQRNWLLNRAMAEFASDLEHLDSIGRAMVPGTEQFGVRHERPDVHAAEQEIMEDWQIPIMRAMSEVVARHGGRVLEVGFGRGVSAAFIQQFGVRSHTIIECSEAIVADCRTWAAAWPGREIEIVPGRWQDVIGRLPRFDSIFFHTYPMNEEEFFEHIGNSVTYAEHFFAAAAEHLEAGGVFTYLSNEVDSLSRAHQRALLHHFGSISISVLGDLELPRDVRDAWWNSSMVIVEARK